ncbi:WD40-repeat-containing domain protein [Xylariales sp. AK1849]|nr:WD40-repeat-containing domain protein [Xylariales sp. AK1849]
MSSFFTVPGAQKRKRDSTQEGPKKRFATTKSTARGPSKPVKSAKAAPAPKRRERDDESISGSDSESEDALADDDIQESGSDSEKEGETAAEKRLRLAERALDNIKQEVVVGFDAEDVDRDIIAERLKDDAAAFKGKVYLHIADELALSEASHCLFRAGDTHSTTSVAICPPYAYTVSKDSVLIKLRLQDLPKNQYPQTTKRKPKKSAPPRKRPEKVNILKGNRHKAKDKSYQGHVGEILCVAASQDGKFVVTGGSDRRLIIYDAKTLKTLKVFQHHRDAVTALKFRRGTNQLYSASKDRTVKCWDVESLAYIETLFGHADEVVDIDALAQERCVSVGARDRTARLWKIVDESQLVYRSNSGVDKKRMPDVDPRSMALEGSMDRVAMLDDELFVTGSDNGSLCLWSVTKKKPLFVLPQAHGLDPPPKPEEISAEEFPDPKDVPAPQPRWITALRTLHYSDVILSGSWDGHIRCWKLSEDKKRIEPCGFLGQPRSRDSCESNSVSGADHRSLINGTQSDYQSPWLVKGIINDIAVFERGKDGLCVVAAVGKEHRFGRWKQIQGAKNGAVVFEIPRVQQPALANGDGKDSEERS